MRKGMGCQRRRRRRGSQFRGKGEDGGEAAEAADTPAKEAEEAAEEQGSRVQTQLIKDLRTTRPGRRRRREGGRGVYFFVVNLGLATLLCGDEARFTK